jgi:hypothetical protein
MKDILRDKSIGYLVLVFHNESISIYICQLKEIICKHPVDNDPFMI